MISKALYTCNSDNWSTPQELYNKLDKLYHFTLDPCASVDNAKCKKFFTELDNGLSQDWSNERVFCNPPYSDIKNWVAKCANSKAELVVLLIPARTDTKYFHEYIYHKPNITIEFIKGRLKFGDSKNSAPFPSMLVIFKNKGL